MLTSDFKAKALIEIQKSVCIAKGSIHQENIKMLYVYALKNITSKYTKQEPGKHNTYILLCTQQHNFKIHKTSIDKTRINLEIYYHNEKF